MYISNWFRGRAGTLMDLLNTEVGRIAILNRMAYEEAQDRRKQEQKKGEDLQDAIEESM